MNVIHWKYGMLWGLIAPEDHKTITAILEKHNGN